MVKYKDCVFEHIDDAFTFGKYRNMTLSDIIEFDPNYIEWCQKNTQNVLFLDSVVEEIKSAYPEFVMDYECEEKRTIAVDEYYNDLCDDLYEDYDSYRSYRDEETYEEYNGSWAQDVEGYSDDDIDTIFDGDPDAYWNID